MDGTASFTTHWKYFTLRLSLGFHYVFKRNNIEMLLWYKYNDIINEGGSQKAHSGFISQITEVASEKLHAIMKKLYWFSSTASLDLLLSLSWKLFSI